MRNPGRWRNVGLTAVVSGLVAAAVVAALPGVGDGLRAALACWASVAVLFGGATAWSRQRDLRARAALVRGEDVLAQWRVEADVWRRFAALDRAQAGPPYNELTVRDGVLADGVQVIVGRTALMVDGSVHRVPTRGTPEVTHAALIEGAEPPFIELHLYYPAGGHGASGIPMRSTRTRLRFPVAPEVLREARQVVAHYDGSLGGAPDSFHGRGDGGDAEDLSRCWSCGFETHRFRSHCPRCGNTLQSRRWSHRFGVWLTLCGAFITAGMGFLLLSVGPLLRQPGREIQGTTFNGSPVLAAAILLLFGVVFAFGATALCYGLWQMATGRRNRRVAYAMVAVFALLPALARWF